jgi:hypothetical protein
MEGKGPNFGGVIVIDGGTIVIVGGIAPKGETSKHGNTICGNSRIGV